jgi:hypothetical protein
MGLGQGCSFGRLLVLLPSAPHLDGGDPCGEEATWQPGGPAAHSIVRAGGRRVHLSERQEEEKDLVLLTDFPLTVSIKVCVV